MSFADRCLLIALLTSLGLPWAYESRTVNGTYTVPGYVVPSICRSAYGADGFATVECTQGYVAPSMQLPENRQITNTINGQAHPGRFGVVAAALLMAWAARQRSARLQAGAGVLLLSSNVLTAGMGFHTAGASLAWIVGMVLLSRGLAARRRDAP